MNLLKSASRSPAASQPHPYGRSTCAQDVYKIGMSAGLTGYAATVDRAWRDGVEIAVDALNAKGGILGRKVQVIVEDNRSEPQEAVTAYRKMISSDNVNVFASGCVSAGNFAAAPLVVKRRNAYGAVLHPAAAAGPGELGFSQFHRPVSKSRPGSIISRTKPRSKRSACCTILRLTPMPKCGRGEGSRRLWPRDRR